MTKPAAPPICQSCGKSASFKPLWNKTVQCTQCQSWMVTGPLDNPTKLYGDDYFSGDEYLDYHGHAAIHLKNFKRKLTLIKKWIGNDIESVLDLGCAHGYFLDACKEMGIQERWGTDINEEAIKECQKKGHQAFLNSPEYLKQNLSGKNLVTFWDSYEHLEKPTEILNLVSSNQKKGDFLALSTVDASSFVARFRKNKWRQFHPPTHLNYPTRKGLKIQLNRLGYKVLLHKDFGYYRAFEQYLPILHKLRALTWTKPLRHAPLYLNLFDTQFVLAKKN